jgi:ElaB/YqjD/DUF883 family membrane-anchored ribosome-binding protein
MASGNQNRPQGQGQGQGQGRHNGGSFENVREQAQNIGQRLQERADEMGDQLHQHADRAREQLAHGHRRVEGMVARNPASSVLVGFGIGFGIGLALTALLTQSEETWADRYLPDSLRGLPRRFQDLADSGRDIAEHLADSGRDVADRVSNRIPRRFRG